ncbi:MAG: phosphate regulon sensor histidine kinase PhoR [Gammaproteobacteria bacterium]|nr:phosphate regulon sensor histidine kinase PhoR [Gammaproteobacteria bacterium]NNF61407.1 phosphate regulon sensor histidine kinase PhoR [Gammaproteobacteria bacterium]
MKGLASVLLLPTLVVATSLLLGYGSGYPLQFLSAGLAVLLAWQLLQLWRLLRWLGNSDSAAATPNHRGAWSQVYAAIGQLRENRAGNDGDLRSALRAFRQSADALPDGVAVLNEHRQLVWLNRAAADLLGLDSARDRGQRITNLIRKPKFVKFIGQHEHPEPLVIRGRGKPRRQLSLQLVTYGDNQQILMVRDVTRERQVEKMRRDFVANVSHELRTPMTVITGYVDEMLTDRALIGEWGPQLDTIMAQAARMKAIVTDLLRLSRLESALEDAGYEAVALAKVLSSIRLEAIARYSEGTAISIEVSPDAALLGDYQELYSALSNLVDNAVKYTGETGAVRVRFEQQADGSAKLSVTDSGPGISAKHLPRLTERFYRVDKGRDRERGGTGLGLAIVKHVLQRHNAELVITSSPGEGSCFACVFPPERVTLLAAETRNAGAA